MDADRFRMAVGHFASGVTVITTTRDGTFSGMTASAVTSLSLDPPMMLICLMRGKPTEIAVRRSGRFAVNVLTESQETVARHFAAPRPDKFETVDTTLGPLGMPIITGALASFECEVESVIGGGTHAIFLGKVATADTAGGRPLTYFCGEFGSFAEIAGIRPVAACS